MGRRALAWLLSWIVRGWIWTLRLRVTGSAIGGPGWVAFWHGDQLPLLGARPAGPLIAPMSLSRDGRLQRLVLKRLGIDAADGSSSRGGARAARGLLRAVGGGALALIAVDGPRGPRRRVKRGIIYLAARTGLPIWPVGVAVGRGRRLSRAWDRFLLPGLFSRGLIVVGEPLTLAREVDLDDAVRDLESRLLAVGRAAADRVGK